jgi:glutamyl-tRNA synthetase
MPQDIVRTRFAPSPTGGLHIGSVRTALFNWLYARHWGGQFLLRIEDTDVVRSTQESVTEIMTTLEWMGLHPDEPPVFQSQRIERYQEIAQYLLNQGSAYKCYATPQELEAMKEQARQEGRPPLYNGCWRDRSSQEAPLGAPYVVRLKAPREGSTVLEDLVQGCVSVDHKNLDDMVLLRSDGSPTYMLAVVVDDHDMAITHVIRGDDHLSNTFRQLQIFKALKWTMPSFAHIPLIHGSDGSKLSKRHGCISLQEYKADGFLPEALANYLLRLGWAHGNDEVISKDQAVKWFDLPEVGRSPARFDLAKLTHLNQHYIQKKSPQEILKEILPDLETHVCDLSQEARGVLLAILPELQKRSRTLKELVAMACSYAKPLIFLNPELIETITPDQKNLIKAFVDYLSTGHFPWKGNVLEEQTREFSAIRGISLGVLAKPLRVVLTGEKVSPSLFAVMASLGKKWSIERLKNFLDQDLKNIIPENGAKEA